MKVVSVINIKGGVGKTTLTANLGAELASRGMKVLLIDLDPQTNLTFSFFHIDYWSDNLAPEKTLKRWLEAQGSGQEQVRLAELAATSDTVRPFITHPEGVLDIIPSHLGLLNIDNELATSISGAGYGQVRANFMKVHRMLAEEFRDRSLRRKYDVVLIDCAPNFNVLNKAALIASDWILVPAKADHLSTLGMEYLLKNFKKLTDDYRNFARARSEGEMAYPRISPTLLGVVFSMVPMRLGEPIQAVRPFVEKLRQLEDIPVFDTIIRERNALFAAAPRHGVPVSVMTSLRDEVSRELDDLATEFAVKAGLKGAK